MRWRTIDHAMAAAITWGTGAFMWHTANNFAMLLFAWFLIGWAAIATGLSIVSLKQQPRHKKRKES